MRRATDWLRDSLTMGLHEVCETMFTKNERPCCNPKTVTMCVSIVGRQEVRFGVKQHEAALFLLLVAVLLLCNLRTVSRKRPWKGKKYLFGPGIKDHIPGLGFGQMGMGVSLPPFSSLCCSLFL